MKLTTIQNRLEDLKYEIEKYHDAIEDLNEISAESIYNLENAALDIAAALALLEEGS